MIRFIDLRSQDIDARFAFFDTETERFIEDGTDIQAWDTFKEFILNWEGTIYDLDRMAGLTPDWAKEPQQEDVKDQ